MLVLDHNNFAEDKSEVPEARGGGSDAAPTSGSSSYADDAYLNDLKLGCRLVPLPDPGAIRSAFPFGVPVGSFGETSWPYLRCTGYINRDGGWADAGQGMGRCRPRHSHLVIESSKSWRDNSCWKIRLQRPTKRWKGDRRIMHQWQFIRG